ncbi:MAG: hypothetical protein M3O99_03840 [Chloroflexota bacterium]|nr:hypothetical protein [Chloroflexota bacterium]
MGSETATGVGLGGLDGLALGDAAANEGVGELAVAPPVQATAATMIANSGGVIRRTRAVWT